MKKVIVIALSVVMAIGLAGCSKEDNLPKEKEIKEETTKALEEGAAEIKELKGKTLKDAIDSGYQLSGYSKVMGDVELYLVYSGELDNDEIRNMISSMENKTVSELRDTYDFSIECGPDKDEFTTYIGSITYYLEFDNMEEIYNKYNEEYFYNWEEIEEIQNYSVKNIKVKDISIDVEINEKSCEKVVSLNDLGTEEIEAIAEKITINQARFMVK